MPRPFTPGPTTTRQNEVEPKIYVGPIDGLDSRETKRYRRWSPPPPSPLSFGLVYWGRAIARRWNDDDEISNLYTMPIFVLLYKYSRFPGPRRHRSASSSDRITLANIYRLDIEVNKFQETRYSSLAVVCGWPWCSTRVQRLHTFTVTQNRLTFHIGLADYVTGFQEDLATDAARDRSRLLFLLHV